MCVCVHMHVSYYDMSVESRHAHQTDGLLGTWVRAKVFSIDLGERPEMLSSTGPVATPCWVGKGKGSVSWLSSCVACHGIGNPTSCYTYALSLV